MKRFELFLSAPLILTLLIFFPDRSQAQNTENVFIVAIDGIRSTEGFDAGNRYLPLIWDSLRPQGTIYPNFINSGITVTNAGHSTIVTGARQLLLNNLEIQTELRPKEPTLGEYYRKTLDIPKRKVYYISGKDQIWRYPISLYPGYGPKYAPTVTLTSHDDHETWDSTRVIMDRDHPSLMYILFAEVDVAGHTGDTTYYIGSIRRADSLVYRVWNKIQSDPVYRNKTTMIVTSDHGRHDDRHGGWRHHFDFCQGCRVIPFLALGPEIRKGAVIDALHDQIDIAPTVGYLLGFSTPFAQGTVMSEMFEGYQSGSGGEANPPASNVPEINLSNSPGYSRSCDIAVNGQGIHVVYSDNSRGPYEIYYTKSADGGEHWSTPSILFEATSGSYTEPVIAAVGANTLFVAAEGYHYVPKENTYMWVLTGKRSADGGITWGAETAIDTSGTVSSKPAISTWGNTISVVSSKYITVSHSVSRDGGLTFQHPFSIDRDRGPNFLVATSVGSFGHPQSPACVYSDTTCYAVWQNLVHAESPYWDIWVNRGPWRQAPNKITQNGSMRYAYSPSIAATKPDVLHLLYARLPLPSVTNDWGVEYRRSVDGGFGLSLTTSISGKRVAFEPVIKASKNGSLYALWADFTEGQWSIWGANSGDGGFKWTNPYRVTSTQTFAAAPRLAVANDTLYIAWEGFRSGNWDIFFRRVGLSELNDLQLNQGLVPEQTTLSQNYPNPFNPRTTIEFTLSKSGSTSLKIFNLLGEEVATLVAENLETGTYRAVWNASGYPSGVYFYRLQNEGTVETRKLMVIK